MNRVSNRCVPGKASKKKRPAVAASDQDISLAVRLPVYVASVGLLFAYVGGYLHAGLGGLAWGLIGVTAAAELLKPKLGELAALALNASDRTAQVIIAIGAFVCVLIGAAGGVVAMHVADAPRMQYEAAERVLIDARADVADAQTWVDSVPTCTPEMPATRCDRMTFENAPVLAQRTARLSVAQANERVAREYLGELTAPAPGLPAVALWQKALFVGGAEFLLLAVPFAAMRLRRPPRATTAQAHPTDIALSLTNASNDEAAPKSRYKVNDGGWASRRAKYGISGRKPKRGAHLKMVGA